jgi:hypothetical protein
VISRALSEAKSTKQLESPNDKGRHK